MENKQNWEQSSLRDYLRYGNLRPYNAWCLLAGFDYKKSQNNSEGDLDLHSSLNPGSFKIEDTLEYEMESVGASDDHLRQIKASATRDLNQMRRKIVRLRDFWNSDQLENEEHPPSFFINWAVSKGMSPDWLDWACENKLYVADENTSINYFDESDPCYALELDIALKAWKAVSVSYEESVGKKPKALIEKWLEKNYPKLTNSARERISTVVNWDKTGGAPKTY